jgi:hypothetical protein
MARVTKEQREYILRKFDQAAHNKIQDMSVNTKDDISLTVTIKDPIIVKLARGWRQQPYRINNSSDIVQYVESCVRKSKNPELRKFLNEIERVELAQVKIAEMREALIETTILGGSDLGDMLRIFMNKLEEL